MNFRASAVLALALSALPAAAIEINSEKSGWQKCPAVLVAPAGGYMVIFASDFGEPGSPKGVRARRIGSAGERIGPELSLDSDAGTACLTAAPSGPDRFLVSWGVYKPLSLQTIYARHFDFQGNPVGPKFEVGEGFSYLPPSASCDPQGRCWIAWIGTGVDSVRLRRFDLSGEPLTDEILVDTPDEIERYQVQVSANPQGDPTVVWWNGDTSTGTPEDPPPPPNGEILLRRFSAAGDPLSGEVPVGTDPAFAYYSPSVCHGASGSLFVAGIRVRKSDRHSEVILRRFDASGAPVGAEILVAQTDTTWLTELACGPDGSVLLLWANGNSDPDLFGRLFNAAGEPTGAPFLVSGNGEHPSAVLAGPGRFFVAWSAYLGDPNGDDVFGRAFHPDVQLPLRQGRFRIEATFRDPETGELGQAHAVQLTEETGLLWFFSSSNVELVVKLLDGCGVNGHYWFFAAGLTDVEVEITVTDTIEGSQKQYRNPPKRAFQPIQDTSALACH